MFSETSTACFHRLLNNQAMHDTFKRMVLAAQEATRTGDITPKEIGDLLGETQQTVTNWRSRGVSQQGILKLNDRLGVNPMFITSGAGKILLRDPIENYVRPSTQDKPEKKRHLNEHQVEYIQARAGLPLISWIQAGEWSDLSDPYRPGEAEDWLPSPARTGPRAYCLRVRGDSMYNPGGRPSYSNGDIIFVDPDKDAKPGDRVIVRLDDQHEATFKQLLVEDGRKMLKALNPEWTPRYIEINGNATITGVVVGKWVPE